MRWLIAYIIALLVSVAMLLLFVTYGIGGCDCGLDEKGLFCWLCEHQLVYLVFATSPLWVVALINLRANMRKHRRELYGNRSPPISPTTRNLRNILKGIESRHTHDPHRRHRHPPTPQQ